MFTRPRFWGFFSNIEINVRETDVSSVKLGFYNVRGSDKNWVDLFTVADPVLSAYNRVRTLAGKMGRHWIFQSGNFEQTWKVGENHTKYWKTWGILDKYYLLFFRDI